MTGLAPLLFAPNLGPLRNVDLDPFDKTSISDVDWNNISLEIPEFPDIILGDAPNVTDPLEPIAPVVSLGEFPEQTLESLEIDTSCTHKVDIGIPPAINFRTWDELVPRFEESVPTGWVNWQWEELAYALTTVLADKYDLLILPEAYLGRAQYRNRKIWETPIDQFIQRGAINSYQTRKDLEAKKESRELTNWVLIEKHSSDLALDRILVTNRQEHQRILRQYHHVKQTLNFSYIKSVLDANVKHYNACVQAMNAQLVTYREQALVYLGNIQRRGLLINEMERRTNISEGLHRHNRAMLGRLKEQIKVQKGVINFFTAQMELSKATLRVELLQIELDRLEISNFASLNQALIKEIEQDISAQEAEIEKVKITLRESIRERLEAQLTEAQVELASAKIIFSAQREAFDAIQEAREEVHNNFDLEVLNKRKIIQESIEGDEGRGFLAREQHKEDLENLLQRQARLLTEFESDKLRVASTALLELQEQQLDKELADAREETRLNLKNAELAAETTLASSNIKSVSGKIIPSAPHLCLTQI